MARALTAQRSVVTPDERERFLERLRKRREFYRAAGCRYWVFEETDLMGAFIEFIEAEDAGRLQAALAEAPDKFIESARIYQETELD